ncbi:MAG: RNA polymerase sigma factor [bacterium]
MQLTKSNFNKFYNKHFSRVYRFVFYRVNMNREVAEDLTSEIFIKALRSFAVYDPAQSQNAWIMTIARNHVINHWRDRKDVIDIDQIAFKIEGTDGRDDLIKADDKYRLNIALCELDDKEKHIIELKYLLGYRYKEIGELLGKTAGAARIDAHRAMKNLKTIFENQNNSLTINKEVIAEDAEVKARNEEVLADGGEVMAKSAEVKVTSWDFNQATRKINHVDSQ